jgi:hypothetical protein
LNAAGDVEWNYMEKDVVIHDRLMTDAALGTRPIKTEHSYSLASDGDSLPDSPISHNKLDGECWGCEDPQKHKTEIVFISLSFYFILLNLRAAVYRSSK